MNSYCKLLRFKQLRFANVYAGFRRHLYSPGVLGVLEYDYQKTIWKEKLGHKKGEFLKKMELAASSGNKIFTEDLKTLCYLANRKEEFKLFFKVLDRYCELQEKKAFQTYFPAGFYALCMLYRHGQHEMAFEWFLDEKYNVRPLCASRECFLLMMDLLYESGRYQDVVELLPLCDTVFDKKQPELITLVLHALYRINTRQSYEQMQAILNELCTDPVQLTIRSAMLCSMLAYKQGDIDMMLEIPHLPVFRVCTGALITAIPNLQILAYIELGHIEKAVDILKAAVIRFKKPVNLFFDEVLEKLDAFVEASSDVEQKALYKQIRRTLTISGFMYPSTMEEYMLRTIGFKEHERLMTVENPSRIQKEIRTALKPPDANPLIT